MSKAEKMTAYGDLDKEGWPLVMPEPPPERFLTGTLTFGDCHCPLGWTWLAFRGHPTRGVHTDAFLDRYVTPAEKEWLDALRTAMRKRCHKGCDLSLNTLNDHVLSRKEVAAAWRDALRTCRYTEGV